MATARFAGDGTLFLEKENGIPLYRQLAEILRRQIADGVLAAGQKLPSEADLSAVYGINRHTVRQAVALLVAAGMVYTLKGSGTFVARTAAVIDYRVSSRTCFTENILNLGHRPGARVLRQAELQAPVRVAGHLGIAAGERIVFLEVLRFVDDVPVSVTSSYLPSARVSGLLEKLPRYTSLYALLQAEYGIRPVRTRSLFQATFPTLDDARALGIPRNVPVLRVESTMALASGLPVEYGIARMRGDRIRVSVDLAGMSAEGGVRDGEHAGGRRAE